MHIATTARALATAALILFAACGGKGSNEGAQSPTEAPAAAPGEPSAAQPMTREDCEKQGGRVAGDIGDGKIQCNEGEKELGRVTLGIEGGVCCAPSGGGAAPAAGGGGGW